MFLPRLLKKHPRVIISHRNSGFGDNLLAAAKAWYYAKNTNRALVIFWHFSRYLDDKRENAFTHFFNVPESIESVPVIAESRMDRLSALLISHPYFHSLKPDPLLILYKVLCKLRLNSDNLFEQRMRGRQEATDQIINNLIHMRQKIIVTHGCYVPDENLRPFFDSLDLNEEFRKRADEFILFDFSNSPRSLLQLTAAQLLRTHFGSITL